MHIINIKLVIFSLFSVFHLFSNTASSLTLQLYVPFPYQDVAPIKQDGVCIVYRSLIMGITKAILLAEANFKRPFRVFSKTIGQLTLKLALACTFLPECTIN